MQSTCCCICQTPSLFPLTAGPGWERLQVAHAHGKRLHYPLEIQLRFVFYFALECAPGREAQQDADALAAHDAAGQRVRAEQDETQGRGRVHEMRVLLLNNTRRLLQFSHLAVAHQVATLQAERNPARSSHLVAKCHRALRQMPQSVSDLFFNKLTMRGKFMNK